ncbi:PcfJ domain-containing protein [Marinobacter salexigens]|uniref:PcfJ domain-containing protein n=1 Tax=Marinobacter salexigens TaxID=1925763 RepID=UPI000C287CAD|nr:PcfJ domain-containing protein [Marinobacter salexigens]
MTEPILENAAYSEHQVVFDLSTILNYPIHLVVQSWHSVSPLHWFSRNNDGIVAEGRFLEAPGLPLFTLEDDSGKRLSDGIPENILKVTRLMPALDFELAQACAASQAACELADSSPLLFILLVNHACKQLLTVQEFQQLLALKRTMILDRIGLPSSKSLARLVYRIELSPLLPWELEDVIKALRQPEILSILRHHKKLHLNHLRFLLRQRYPLWPGMLNLIGEHSSALDISWSCRMVRDTLNMAAGNVRRLEQVRSREALQELHDRLVERFNSMGSEDKRTAHAAALEREHGRYPTPPLAAIDGIEPLTSWLDLLDEGASMHHCVGSYDLFVADRDLFIYRMVTPERLTISLEQRNNTWVIGEVRGSRNANPSPGALDIVRRWVEL